jgi:hypothetical protein
MSGWLYWAWAWFVYLIPLLLVTGFWLWFFPFMKAYRRYQARTVEHMDKVEALLERVARATESKRSD